MNEQHVYVLLQKPAYKGKLDRPTANDLYCATKVPLAEFVHTGPREIAAFLIADSYTPAWARRHRRPIQPGDGFWLRGTTYLFTAITGGDKFTMSATTKINLREILSR